MEIRGMRCASSEPPAATRSQAFCFWYLVMHPKFARKYVSYSSNMQQVAAFHRLLQRETDCASLSKPFDRWGNWSYFSHSSHFSISPSEANAMRYNACTSSSYCSIFQFFTFASLPVLIQSETCANSIRDAMKGHRMFQQTKSLTGSFYILNTSPNLACPTAHWGAHQERSSLVGLMCMYIYDIYIYIHLWKEVWKLNFRQYGQMERAQPGRNSDVDKVRGEKIRDGEDKRWRKSEGRRCRCAKT